MTIILSSSYGQKSWWCFILCWVMTQLSQYLLLIYYNLQFCVFIGFLCVLICLLLHLYVFLLIHLNILMFDCSFLFCFVFGFILYLCFKMPMYFSDKERKGVDLGKWGPVWNQWRRIRRLFCVNKTYFLKLWKLKNYFLQNKNCKRNFYYAI